MDDSKEPMSEDGEISDGELEDSEDEGEIAGTRNESGNAMGNGNAAPRLVTQQSEPLYALFTSKRPQKGKGRISI